MSNNTQPPFAIGQKVVRVINSPWGKVGDIEVVEDVIKCKCGKWYVDVGHAETHKLYISVCDSCHNERIVSNGKRWYLSTSFAPIHPAHADITKELCAQPIEERLDVPKINEPVLS